MVTRRNVLRNSGLLLSGFLAGCLSDQNQSGPLQFYIVNYTTQSHTIRSALRNQDEEVILQGTYQIAARDSDGDPTETKVDNFSMIKSGIVVHLSASLDGGITRYYDHKITCASEGGKADRIFVEIRDGEIELSGNKC